MKKSNSLFCRCLLIRVVKLLVKNFDEFKLYQGFLYFLKKYNTIIFLSKISLSLFDVGIKMLIVYHACDETKYSLSVV